MRHFLALPASLAALVYTALATPPGWAQNAPALGSAPEVYDATDNLPDEMVQKYVTRPDLVPAKWKIQINDRTRLAPGYWFVSPYEKNGYRLPGGSWIGPHIYDQDGELVWSGSQMFNHINVMDFKVLNVGGEKLLSMLYAVEGSAYLLDKHYQVQETVFTGETGVVFNMHDFNTVEEGKRYLYLQRNITETSSDVSLAEIDYDGPCQVTFPGFEERDVRTKQVIYKWDASGKISMNESTLLFLSPEERCAEFWDFLHSNAVDKFNDGNYLLSTRHSDTIYKISKHDGSIMWRLQGFMPERSDFEMGDVNFSRQHHARLHENNETHVVISMLDNALGADPQPPSNKWSRAIKILLRVDKEPMTAETISAIDHPYHDYAFRRGSHQILPNGNAFVGWSERALQSEHAPDGTLLMKAELLAEDLGTYRAFKFPWVAQPEYPPDVVSHASRAEDDRKAITLVHVSWNGATEVAHWSLYKTNAKGETSSLVLTVPRTGFETALEIPGYARYVFVRALDKDGKPLEYGQSLVQTTIVVDDLPHSAVAAEKAFLADAARPESLKLVGAVFREPIVTLLLGIVCGIFGFFLVFFLVRSGWVGRRFARGKARYSRVAPSDAAEFDEAKLDGVLSAEKVFTIGDDGSDGGELEESDYRDMSGVPLAQRRVLGG